MKSKGKKSLLNFTVSILNKVAVIAVGLIIPKLFITSYGSELNGLQASVRQIFTYIALLEAGVGASTLQMLYRPVAQNDHKTANAYLSATSIYYNRIGVAYFAILFLMSVFYSAVIPVTDLKRWQVLAYILVSGAVTGINFFYIAKIKLVISAEGDMFLVSLVTLITYVLSSAMKVLLIYSGVQIILIEAIHLLINFGTTGCYYLIARKKYPWLSFKEKPDFSCTEQKRAVLIHRITSVVFQNVDVLILTAFCSLQIVSIYTMYKLVVNMIVSITGAVCDSVNFIFGQEFNLETDPEKPKYRRLIDTFNVYYSAMAMGLYTVVYILILPFLRLYTDGMDVNYIYPVVPALYVLIEFLLVGREAMVRTIDVAGHYRKTQWRAVVETIINLTASVVFALLFKPWFGEIGVLYGVLTGTICALLYRTLDIVIYANKRILHRTPWQTLGIMGQNLLIFCGMICLFNLFTIRIDNYGQFILHGCWITAGMLTVYCTVHSLIHPKEAGYILNYLKKRFLKLY